MKENLNQKADLLICEIVKYDYPIKEEINQVRHKIQENKKQIQVLQDELKELDKDFTRLQEKSFQNYRAIATLKDLINTKQ